MAKPNDPLSLAITDAVLRRLAGDDSYTQGLDLFLHGHVESFHEIKHGIQAGVRGAEPRSVELTAEDRILDYSCDCPAGAEAAFCRHCVAAALAWTHREPERKKARKPKAVTIKDVEKLLLEEEKQSLVRRIIDLAKTDRAFRSRLILEAARHADPETVERAVLEAFTKSLSGSRSLRSRNWPAYTSGINEAIDAIEQLLTDGRPAAALRVTQQAVELLDEKCAPYDQTDFRMESIRMRLGDVHFEACEQAPPKPEVLASWLFHRELSFDPGPFVESTTLYADILGPAGVEVFRTLARQEWASIPAQKGRGYYERPPIRRIMASIAEQTSDVELHADILSRNLTYASDYLRIAKLYREAGQGEKALEWAERGRDAFPDMRDHEFSQFLANEYWLAGRRGQAADLAWGLFTASPWIENYRVLKAIGDLAGEWPAWRERALSLIRGQIAETAEKVRSGKPWWAQPFSDHTLLVEIHLFEGDLEAAWSEAKKGGCAGKLWLRLADLLSQNRPDDCLEIYLRLADRSVEQGNNSGYKEAVELLVRAAAIAHQSNIAEKFRRELQALETKRRAKRNFINLLEENRARLQSAAPADGP